MEKPGGVSTLLTGNRVHYAPCLIFLLPLETPTKIAIAMSLSNYPGLDKWESSHSWTAKDHQEMCCSLGADGSYYISAPTLGQSRLNLDNRLDKEIEQRHTEGKMFDGDPASVTLGIKGSYVLVGKKGDLFWDLKGEYKPLDLLLKESEVGVKVSTSLPFMKTMYSSFLHQSEEKTP